VQDVNAEANIITALICHADGSRPGKACHHHEHQVGEMTVHNKKQGRVI
jgi:hypothetical protein